MKGSIMAKPTYIVCCAYLDAKNNLQIDAMQSPDEFSFEEMRVIMINDIIRAAGRVVHWRFAKVFLAKSIFYYPSST